MEYENLQKIIQELQKYAKEIKEEETKEVVTYILQAKNIFVAGAGRSGFAARGFANRLMHLGFSVAFAGEPTAPPIKEGDLLIIGSGSGNTESLAKMAEQAKKTKAKIALVTIDPKSVIANISDAVIIIPGDTRKLSQEKTKNNSSIQPTGSLFEQLSWLVYDSLVLDLKEKTNQTFEDILKRHGNLE